MQHKVMIRLMPGCAHQNRGGQLLEHAVELIDVQLADVFLLQEGGEIAQEGRRDPVCSRDASSLTASAHAANPGSLHATRFSPFAAVYWS